MERGLVVGGGARTRQGTLDQGTKPTNAHLGVDLPLPISSVKYIIASTGK